MCPFHVVFVSVSLTVRDTCYQFVEFCTMDFSSTNFVFPPTFVHLSVRFRQRLSMGTAQTWHSIENLPFHAIHRGYDHAGPHLAQFDPHTEHIRQPAANAELDSWPLQQCAQCRSAVRPHESTRQDSSRDLEFQEQLATTVRSQRIRRIGSRRQRSLSHFHSR